MTEKSSLASSPSIGLGWKALRVAFVIFALVFFAVHGDFSFLGSTSTAEVSSISTAGDSRGGFISYGLLPGVAYAIVCWLLVVRGRDVLFAAVENKLMTGIALLTIASAAWSQNPARSVVFGGLFLIDTLFAYYLVVSLDHERLRRLVAYAGGVIAASCIFVSLALPQYGVTLYALRDRGTWHGIFTDRTGCAKCLVFLLSAGVTFVPSKRRLHQAGYFVLLLFLLVMAHAVSSFLVTAIWAVSLSFLAVRSKLQKRTRLLVTMLFSGGVSVCGFFLIFVLPLILQALGRDVTLSGRTVVWKAVMLSIVKRPWLGYGFYAFWQGAKGESAVIIAMLHWVFGYAHNGILEIALQLGVVGVVLFLASLVQALRNASVCIKNGALPQVQWFVSIIILTILYNSDEATVLWPNDLLSILYIVAYCGLSAKASEIRRDLTIALQSQSSIVATVPEEVVAVP